MQQRMSDPSFPHSAVLKINGTHHDVLTHRNAPSANGARPDVVALGFVCQLAVLSGET